MENVIKWILVCAVAGLFLLIGKALGINISGNIELTDVLIITATLLAAAAAFLSYKEAEKVRHSKIRQELHYIVSAAEDAYFLVISYGQNPALSPKAVSKFIELTTKIEEKAYSLPKPLFELKVAAFENKWGLINRSNTSYDLIQEKILNGEQFLFSESIQLSIDWICENRIGIAKKFMELAEKTAEHIEKIRN